MTTATDDRRAETTTPNAGTPLRDRCLNRSGNRPSLAAANGISALIMTQPLSAPKPEMMTATAITLPAQVPPNIVLTASEYGALPVASLELGTIPNTAVSESMYTTATPIVPSTVARGMLRSGLRTFAAATETVSTPM